MKCKYCGATVGENDRVCSTCGKWLVEEPQAQAQPQPQQTVQVFTQQTARNEIVEAELNARNNIAIASLVFVLLGTFCIPGLSFVGFILGLFGIKSNKKGLAVAAIVIFIATVVLGIILGIVLSATLTPYIKEAMEQIMSQIN